MNFSFSKILLNHMPPHSSHKIIAQKIKLICQTCSWFQCSPRHDMTFVLSGWTFIMNNNTDKAFFYATRHHHHVILIIGYTNLIT